MAKSLACILIKLLSLPTPVQGGADKLENVMIIGNNLHVDAFYDEATSTISYLSWTVKPDNAH